MLWSHFMRKTRCLTGGQPGFNSGLSLGLACATDFVGADAAGANGDGFVLTVRHNHFAFLQVRVLEKTVVLVGEANFVGFVATLVANFTDAGHGERSFNFGSRFQVLLIETLKKVYGNSPSS